jgi:hypothetical protein
MAYGEAEWGDMDWMVLVEDMDQCWALVNSELLGSIICWEVHE